MGVRNLHVVYNPEKSAAGNITGWIASIRDLTDSKRTQDSLAESLRREQVLHRFVDRLHRAESDTMVYEAALDSILRGLRCNRASILLFDEAAVMRFVACRGLWDEYIRAVAGHSPWQPDDFNAQPISISDVATADRRTSPNCNSERRNSGVQFVPLVNGRKLIGKFMFYYNSTHVCSSEEIDTSQSRSTLICCWRFCETSLPKVNSAEFNPGDGASGATSSRPIKSTIRKKRALMPQETDFPL